MRRLPLPFAIAVAANLLHPAIAAEKTRILISNAANYCQAALPVFDEHIRKRPLAVQNEGAADAFISCAFGSQVGVIDQVDIALSSSTAGAVSCTGVMGSSGPGVLYSVKSVDLPGGEVKNSLKWNASDFGDKFIYLFSVSCRLPPGTGIHDTYVEFKEDV